MSLLAKFKALKSQTEQAKKSLHKEVLKARTEHGIKNNPNFKGFLNAQEEETEFYYEDPVAIIQTFELLYESGDDRKINTDRKALQKAVEATLMNMDVSNKEDTKRMLKEAGLNPDNYIFVKREITARNKHGEYKYTATRIKKN